MTMTLAVGEVMRVLLLANLVLVKMMTLVVGAVHLRLHLLPLRLITRAQLRMISLETFGVKDSSIGLGIIDRREKQHLGP